MTSNGVKFYNSIGFRLSVLITAVIFFSVVVLSFFNAMKSFDRETESYKSLMTGVATAYAASVSNAVDEGNRLKTLSALRGIRDLPNVVQVDVVSAEGEVFAELGTGSWLVSDGDRDVSLWRADSVRVETPIVKGGVEIAYLGMLVDLKPLRAEILTNLVATLISSLIVLLLGALLAQLVIGRMMRPISRLTRAMADIRDGGADGALDLNNRNDETGIMTQTFLDMMGSIRDRDVKLARHMETLEETVEARTHDLRIAKEDAEAANAAKSDFLATMSHEIRTPMNGMMVMAEMLGAADLTPRHRRYAEIIHRSGNSLLTIINDILDLSKIEAGQLDLETIPVSPEQLVMDVTSLFWERARSKNLDLATYISPRVPAEILADPTRLNQIISNLVNNALKFTDEGGVLIRVDAEEGAGRGTRLKIDVIDTGIGIPDDKIESIFESFSQADQSTTRRFGGTGLGLTVCQRLVSAMSGEISVMSTVGKGSTFQVLVPVCVHQEYVPIETGNINVGVNLDDGLIKIALEQMLTDLGCKVSTSEPDFWISSPSSFEACHKPIVLLSDIGDTNTDRLLTDGNAADCLALPYSRQDVAHLLLRAAHHEFRGRNAMRSNSESKRFDSFKGLRVLAADDNAVNREVLREALATLNVNAYLVENGAEAVEAFRKHPFDLVFMDGSMPVMDGFDATRAIRAIEAETGQAQTPIIALTAQVTGAGDDAWQDAGADGHVLKPFTIEKLNTVLLSLQPSNSVSTALESSYDEPPLLDMQTVGSLEQLGAGDGSVRDKVWNMFAEKAPDMLAQLHDLLSTSDFPAIAKQAHAFKSMALSSGLGRLARELQEVEQKSVSESLQPDRTSITQDLQALLQLSQSAMFEHRQRAA